MQKKVEEEGEVEAKLYEKFMCYCKNGASDLEASISAAEDKLAKHFSPKKHGTNGQRQCGL